MPNFFLVMVTIAANIMGHIFMKMGTKPTYEKLLGLLTDAIPLSLRTP
jgi:hypothetical protein